MFSAKNIYLFSFLLIIFLFVPKSTFASVAGEVNKANGLYKQGKFDDSLELYEKALDLDSKSSVVNYDLGTALYKKGDYAKALGYLAKAAEDKNVKIKAKAEYNLGNVLYKTGIQKENTNVDQAIKSLQDALGDYGQVIADDPKDQDALYNQDFVKKQIERLKQKKQEQKQQQQNQQSGKDQKQNQQNQQGQQSQGGQEKPQDQQQQQAQQKNAQDQKKSQAQAAKGQEKQDQQSQSNNGKDQKSQEAQAQQSQKELDRKQAEDLLEDYQENEEPKKLLNYMPKKIDDRPVLKDW